MCSRFPSLRNLQNEHLSHHTLTTALMIVIHSIERLLSSDSHESPRAEQAESIPVFTKYIISYVRMQDAPVGKKANVKHGPVHAETCIPLKLILAYTSARLGFCPVSPMFCSIT